MNRPVIIPSTRLSREALLGLVDEFVTREGTDYGHKVHTLEDKRLSVFMQIKRGDVLIVFDPESETANLKLRREVGDEPPPPEPVSNAPAWVTPKFNQRIIDAFVDGEPDAWKALTDTGVSDADLQAHAQGLGLTQEFRKKCRLSGSRPALRVCMKCDEKFLSSGLHNRLCSHCAPR